MNFLFVDASRKLWGTEQALLELASGCARAGHRVVAVVRADSEMAQAMRVVPGIELHETPFRGGEDPRALWRVLRLGRATRTDWLVTAHSKHHWPLLLGARWLGCRLAAFRHMAYIRSRFTRYWMPRLADRYFVVSEFARQRLISQGVPGRCLHISHNPIDTRRFRPDAEARRRLRQRLGMDEDTPLAGFIGRHTWCKGVSVLRQAVIETMHERPTMHMLWLGEGAELAATKAVVDAVGQAERHHFIAWQVDVEKVYSALDVLLCPSEIEETFGRVVAEAQACGVPVIARDRGGLSEAMADGRTGLLWRQNDAGSLASLLGGLLDDPDRRQAMSAAGVAWVTRFCTSSVVEAFVAQLH
ncbi:glycosyltransferase family 1 protein [Lysobacter pythonis]|uniref:Glycosyltransferase family 1 protein n=1 Tax=Solilutibacter pythonis TaxID=2483112 RepID=A0A3M2HWR6_9GAMM|nr:glycosyltransferase family 4 protein [Lysobacter pythonis]RMH94171.1 glycosyltransferase family 1 protein [Lysobacter pythonis]